MLKLNQLADIFHQRIHLPRTFVWWTDVVKEQRQWPLAVAYNNGRVVQHWFRRLKIFILKQVKDRKLDHMRRLFREQERKEAQQVDDENTFFLNKQELARRMERKRLNDIKVDEEAYQEQWAQTRLKAEQGRIRIHQERHRIAHRKDMAVQEKNQRGEVWTTMEQDVLPRVAEKARQWLLTHPDGKKYVKEMVGVMFQTSLAECQHLLYNRKFNIEGCPWQCVNEVPGVVMSPVAWTNVSTGESIKYQKMTGKMCKQIVIARHVASELLKVRQEFMKRRRTEEGEHLLAKSCLLVQSAYRMRQGRQLAMVEFQRQWCCLVDCGTGAC